MKRLFKYGRIEILSSEQLKNFNYNDFLIMQIENIGENIFVVEVLEKGNYIDRLSY